MILVIGKYAPAKMEGLFINEILVLVRMIPPQHYGFSTKAKEFAY